MNNKQKTITIKNVKIFNGEIWEKDQNVTINDGKIYLNDTILVPDEVIDGRDMTLLPGLIDAHVHILERSDLDNLIKNGVTTGLDMACWPEELVKKMRNEKGTAQFLSATTPAASSGGAHAKIPGFPHDAIISSDTEAIKFVQDRIKVGADYIKVVTEAKPPEGLSLPILETIIGEAHANNLKVNAHAITSGALKLALQASVDVVHHSPIDAILDDPIISSLKSKEIVIVPTLIMMQGTAEFYGSRGLNINFAIESIKKMHKQGINILLGTDSNSSEGVPFSPKHGSAVYQEMNLLKSAGLSIDEIYSAATSKAANTFGINDRGYIKSVWVKGEKVL